MKLTFFIQNYGTSIAYVDYVQFMRVGNELLYSCELDTPLNKEAYNRRVVSLALADDALMVTSSICNIGDYEKDVLSGLNMNRIRMYDIINNDFDISPSQKNATWVLLSNIESLWEDEYVYDILNGPLDEKSVLSIVDKLQAQRERFIRQTADNMHRLHKEQENGILQETNSRVRPRTQRRNNRSSN